MPGSGRVPGSKGSPEFPLFRSSPLLRKVWPAARWEEVLELASKWGGGGGLHRNVGDDRKNCAPVTRRVLVNKDPAEPSIAEVGRGQGGYMAKEWDTPVAASRPVTIHFSIETSCAWV